MNYVFDKVSKEVYSQIKTFLENKLGKGESKEVDYCLDSMQFLYGAEKITILHYTSLKLMIQSNSAEGLIREIEQKFNLNVNQSHIKKRLYSGEPNIPQNFFIGFDESGKGECLGPMFLCATKIKKEDLDFFKNELVNKDIKKLNWERIDNLFNSLKNKFRYHIQRISPEKIDSFDLTMLLDEGYTNLINQVSENISNEAYFIDDYGISNILNKKLEYLKSRGSKIFLAEKADTNYITCMLASLVARKMRNEEMKKLSLMNKLIDAQGNVIGFKSGAPNEETKSYLIKYRELYPYSDFPPFVRKRWKNIKQIDKEFPRKKLKVFFTCKNCGRREYKICMYFCTLDKKTKCFCSHCGKDILKEEVRKIINDLPIIVDTSTIITGSISKDLNTSEYLENFNFIIPSFVYEELDNKQPVIKLGGQREIERLREFSDCKKIFLEVFHVEDHSEIQIDKKFMNALQTKNGVLFSKDKNLVSFSNINAFSIFWIENKEIYLKQIKKSISRGN